MNRRDFLLLTATVSLALPMAARAESLDYTPDILKADLAAGKTVVLHFSATWCGTCQAQVHVLDTLKSANPAYDKSLTFLNVDWDTYKGGDLTQKLNVPERSTIVVLKGDKEIGRLYSETAMDPIKALIDTALQAATS